jgi:hypothetical protein
MPTLPSSDDDDDDDNVDLSFLDDFGIDKPKG